MNHQDSSSFDIMLRQGQIIIIGLAGGVIMFLVIVLGFLGARVQPFGLNATLSLVMAAFAVAAIPARLLVPGLIVSSNCQKIAKGTWSSSGRQPQSPIPDTDEGKLLQVFLSKTIVGAAFLEGAAFANLIAFMLEGQVYSIVLAVLFLFGILAAFPTRSGMSEWLETQQRRLQEYK